MERSTTFLDTPECIRQMAEGTMPVTLCAYGLQPGDWLRLLDAADKCYYVVQHLKPVANFDDFVWDATVKLVRPQPSDPTTWPPTPETAHEMPKPCAFSITKYPVFAGLLMEHERLFADLHPQLVGANRVKYALRKGYQAVPIAYAAAFKHGWLNGDHTVSNDYGAVIVEMCQILRDVPAPEFADLEAVINELCGTCILGITSPILTPTDMLDLERDRRRGKIHNWGLVQVGPVLTHWSTAGKDR